MEWLVVGAVFGVAGFQLSSWARANSIRIHWFAWILVLVAMTLAALAAMDYAALTVGMEPGAAGVILWLFGGPALGLVLAASLMVWWQNRHTRFR